MKKILVSAVVSLLVGSIASPARAAEEADWDVARVARSIDAARQARQQGDLMTAERACYAAFAYVDRSALAAIDAYAALLTSEQRADAATVRAQAARLREIKESQARGTEPSSTYLGFAPADLLNGYADLLRARERPDESARIRSLALAYGQVQQAHFQRTELYRQGRDPRGSC